MMLGEAAATEPRERRLRGSAIGTLPQPPCIDTLLLFEVNSAAKRKTQIQSEACHARRSVQQATTPRNPPPAAEGGMVPPRMVNERISQSGKKVSKNTRHPLTRSHFALLSKYPVGH